MVTSMWVAIGLCDPPGDARFVACLSASRRNHAARGREQGRRHCRPTRPGQRGAASEIAQWLSRPEAGSLFCSLSGTKGATAALNATSQTRSRARYPGHIRILTTQRGPLRPFARVAGTSTPAARASWRPGDPRRPGGPAPGGRAPWFSDTNACPSVTSFTNAGFSPPGAQNRASVLPGRQCGRPLTHPPFPVPNQRSAAAPSVSAAQRSGAPAVLSSPRQPPAFRVCPVHPGAAPTPRHCPGHRAET
jgi:hypothetical protein